MKGRLVEPLWIVPLVIAGLVGAFGWWGNARLRQMIEAQLKAELTSALNANVMALEIWTTNQAKLASSLADEPRTKALALQILDGSGPSRADSQQEAQLLEADELGNYLRPRLAKVGY